MSEKALLEELVKQFKKQNEILERISSAIESIDIPDNGLQLSSMEEAIANIGIILSRQR